MIQIWGKTTKKEKVLKEYTLSINPKTTTFFDMLQQLCTALNIATPVLLDKHVHDFNVFHICIFKPDDFVETVNFDRLVLEYINKD